MATAQQIANRSAYQRGWWDGSNASNRIKDHAQPTYAPQGPTREAYMRGFNKAMEQHGTCDSMCVQRVKNYNAYRYDMASRFAKINAKFVTP